MSHGNYYLPSVGSDNVSYTTYTPSQNAKPQVSSTQHHTDPFAPTVSYGTTTTYGTTTPSTGGYGDLRSYAVYTAPTSNGTTTTYGTTTPSTSGYGDLRAFANYSAPTSYGTTTNYGITTPSTGTNYPVSYSYGGSGATPAAPTTQQQQSSIGKPSVAVPAQQVTVANASSKSSTNSPYQDLIRQLKASGQKYRDSEFPPELNSLTGGLSEYEIAASGNPLNWRGLVWLRAGEIYGKNNFQVFQDSIEPDDVDQGALGDCYFLSTLASLAEKPDRIRKLFVSDQPNEQGCYAVKICDTGIWQTIIMDDFLPCSSRSKQPCFTKGNGNEIWVQLLEKAWAKVYGSYVRIEAGLTRECLHDLTGAPTKYFLTGDPSKYDEIWKAIEKGEKSDYAMTCGAGDFFEGADLMTSIGLVGSHAYSLLAAIEVTDRYGRKVKLVKLRNPWGKGEWTGDWSDESPLWTDQLRRQLHVEDKDDGIFYMSFQDLMKYFSDIQICKIHDDYSYNALKATCDSRHGVYFKITVRERGHYYITLNQESKRKHPEKANYRYSDAYLVLGKKTANGYEYIEGYLKADKEVWTGGHLDAGEYIVYAKVAWNDRKSKDFSISSYGKSAVTIEQVPKSYCADFIDKVYLSKGRQAKKFEDYQHCGVKNCIRTVELTDDGFGFLYYRNDSNKTLEEEIYFKALEGLKLRKPYRGNSYKMVVPPGQERIVITKILPDASRIRQAFTEKSRFV